MLPASIHSRQGGMVRVYGGVSLKESCPLHEQHRAHRPNRKRKAHDRSCLSTPATPTAVLGCGCRGLEPPPLSSGLKPGAIVVVACACCITDSVPLHLPAHMRPHSPVGCLSRTVRVCRGVCAALLRVFFFKKPGIPTPIATAGMPLKGDVKIGPTSFFSGGSAGRIRTIFGMFGFSQSLFLLFLACS